VTGSILGEIATSRANIAEAIALAKELNVMHGLAAALFFAGVRVHYERNTVEVERLASELIELCTRQNFALCCQEEGFSPVGHQQMMESVPYYFEFALQPSCLTARKKESDPVHRLKPKKPAGATDRN
jgi:hypothetical protein